MLLQLHALGLDQAHDADLALEPLQLLSGYPGHDVSD